MHLLVYNLKYIHCWSWNFVTGNAFDPGSPEEPHGTQ